MKTYNMNSDEYKNLTIDTDRSKSLCFKINSTNPIDNKVKIYLNQLFENHLPTDSTIWTPTYIDRANKINIGHHVFINHSLTTVALGGITIEDNVQIGPNVTLLTANHDIKQMNILNTKPIHIKQGAWIGARAIILPGITIGEQAIVGAGSVVTKSVANFDVVAGNPAKVIKRNGESHG